MKFDEIKRKKAEILRKLQDRDLSRQEKDRLSDEFRKLINKEIRQKRK